MSSDLQTPILEARDADGDDGLSRAAAVGGAAWSIVESTAGQLISFLLFLTLARLLSPVDFGVVAVANFCVMVIQSFIYQGLGQAIIQFTDLDNLHLNTIFWINLTFGTTFFLLTIWLAPFVGEWFHTPGLAGVLCWFSPVFIISGLTDVQNNLLARSMNFKALATRTLLAYLIGGLVAVGMAIKGLGVWSLVGQQLTTAIVNFVVLWSASDWRPQLIFCPQRAVRLLRFGGHLLWVDLVTLLNRRSDQLFIGKFLGPIAAGYYAVGARISMLVSEVLAKSVARVSLSALSRIQNQVSRFSDRLCEVVEMQGVLIFPIAVGLATVAPEAMQIFFGSKWTTAVPIMQALLIACPFDALSGAHQAALVARGKPGWASLLTTTHAAANITLFAIAIRWGAVAVAIAFSIRAILLYPLELLALRTALQFPVSRFLKPLLFQILMTGAMCGMLVLIRQKLLLNFSPLVSLLLLVSAGAAFYILALLVLNRTLFLKMHRLAFPRATAA